MQVLEFHFNPNLKPSLIFDSFCYEPENIYERRVGGLYLLGILKNAIPNDASFLDKLAKLIKERYYGSTLVSSEESLKKSLQKCNEYLQEITKDGDVSWLGNLSFGAISIKNFELNFTKTGDIKFVLIRNNQIINIDEKVKNEGIEPYPLKIFNNIISGEVAEGDILLAFTKDIFDFFNSKKITEEIAKIKPFNGNALKLFLKSKEEELSAISGIFLLLFLGGEKPGKEKIHLLPRVPKLKLNKLNLPKLNVPKLNLPKLKFPKLKLNMDFISKNKKIRNDLMLISSFFFFLLAGFFIFHWQDNKKTEKYRGEFIEIERKVNEAESLSLLRETSPQAREKANSLFEQSWEDISFLVKESVFLPKDFGSQILSLKNKISQNLSELNNLEELKNPELVFEFNAKDFVPQKIIYFEKNNYFFSSYIQGLFSVSPQGKEKKENIEQKFDSAISLADSVIFFSAPNQITELTKDGIIKQLSIPLLEVESNLSNMSSYKSHLYFLDEKTGKIIKYSFIEKSKWGDAYSWLLFDASKNIDAKSITVDGSVWVLAKDNSIYKYYAGEFKEILKIAPFPPIKELSKIFTSIRLPYLYISEPIQKRIIVLNKTGKIIKQFQSEKFDNILDFSISENGKNIYILNGLRVFKVVF